MSLTPAHTPDWSKYETNESAPGLYVLTPEQSAEFIAEMDANSPRCDSCGHPCWERGICRRCDRLLPPSA